MNENSAISSEIELSKTRCKIESMEKKSSEAKKEIENLKGELEKLLQSNILCKNTKCDLKEVRIEKNITSKQQSVAPTIKKCTLKDNHLKNPVTPKVQHVLKKQPKKVPEVKVEKVKHYDPKLAREYIKKQKTQRQNKLQEEIRHKIVTQEEKRRKLKELQDKTLKILYNKNRQKQQKDKLSSPLLSKTSFKSTNEKQKKNSSTKVDLCVTNSKNLSPVAKIVKNTKQLTSCSSSSLEKRNLAATKIQAVYRGFKQRSRYKKLIEQNRRKKNNFCDGKLEDQSQPVNTPAWLQPAPALPYPYNFITAVKQKLSLALYGYKYGQNQTDNSTFISENNISLNTPLNNTNSTSDITRTSSELKELALPTSVQKNDSHSTPKQNINELEHRNEIGTQSIKDVVSDLKLNLNSLSSVRTSLSKIVEKVPHTATDYERNKSVASQEETTINSLLSIHNTVTNENSTGNDVESAILSGSESKSISHSTNRHSKDKEKSSYSENKASKICDRKNRDEINENSQKLNKKSTSKASYENTFTSYRNVVENNESSKSSSRHLTAAEKLIPPTDKLRVGGTLSQNISNVKTSTECKPQEINLKFEAEIKLLQTFQESLKQIAAENTVPSLHDYIYSKQDVDQFTQTPFRNDYEYQNQLKVKSSSSAPKVQMENVNTEYVERISYNNSNKITQIISKNKPSEIIKNPQSTDICIGKNLKSYKKFEEKIPFVNYKRGTGEQKRKLTEKRSKDILLQSLSINNSVDTTAVEHNASKTDVNADKNIHGLSLEMIDQQIKNEDIQLEHFKTLLKIREKALVDRTKGELVWLEITKRHLKEKGDINQVSTIKKKQRALILKLQQEKHEMQRLRSVHKASCEERKTILREHKNIIKKQLSTKDMLTQFKRKHSKEVKRTGPMKVYELSNSNNQLFTLYEDKSSQQSSLSISEHVNIRARSDASSEVESVDYKKSITLHTSKKPAEVTSTNLKLALSKREKDLKYRRERVEELLKWHQRLNEDEKQIAMLEEEVRKLTLPNCGDDVTYSFSGSYLNNLWFIITGLKQNKYEQNKRYPFSKIDMENFYENAKIEVLRKIEQLKTSTPMAVIEETDNLSHPIEVYNNPELLKSVSPFGEKLIENIEKVNSHCEKENNCSQKINKHLSDFGNRCVSQNLQSIKQKSKNLEKDTVDSESTLKIDGESITLKSEIKSDYRQNDNSYKRVDQVNLEDVQFECTTKNNSLLQNDSKIQISDEHNYSAQDIQILSEHEQNSKLGFRINDEEIVKSQETSNSCISINEASKTLQSVNAGDSKDNSSVNKKLNDTILTSKSSDNFQMVETLVKEQGNNFKPLKITDENSDYSKISSEDHSIEVELGELCNKNSNNKSSISDQLIISNFEINEDSVIKSESSKVDKSLNSDEEINESLKNFSQIDFENNSSGKRSDSDMIALSKNSLYLTENIEIAEKTEQSNLSIPLECKSENNKTESIEDENIETAIESSVISLHTSSDVKEISLTSNSHMSIGEIKLLEPNSQAESINEIINLSTETSASVNIDDDFPMKNHGTQSNNISDVLSDESISISLSAKSIKNSIDEEIDESSSDFKLISATDLNLQFSVKEPIENSENNSSVVENESLSSNTIEQTVNKNEQSSKNHNTNATVKNCKRKITQLNKLNKDKIFQNELSPMIEKHLDGDNKLNCKNTMIPENLLLDSLSLYSAKISTNKLIVNEAEELRRKQLQIEQEIKELEKQQQSEIVPYVYVREIPNKPPPPYQPPKISPKVQKYTIPTTLEQSMHLITKATDLLYNAYRENSFKTVQTMEMFEHSENEVENNYNRFFSDLCKEIAQNYFAPSVNENEPSWMRPITRQTTQPKIKTKADLQKIVELKVNECLNFSPVPKKENLIICWSRNKRDHVDELLIKESQTEEAEWRNFEYDEITIKNELTVDILDFLIKDTITNVCKGIKRKMNKF